MKKMKSKYRLSLGIIMTVLAGVCILVGVGHAENIRFMVAAVLCLLFAWINYSYAFRKKDFIDEIAKDLDERDMYIAMKSCQKMVLLVNYILLGVILVSLVLYGAFRLTELLVVAITLCGVLVLMLILTLVMNNKLEKVE